MTVMAIETDPDHFILRARLHYIDHNLAGWADDIESMRRFLVRLGMIADDTIIPDKGAAQAGPTCRADLPGRPAGSEPIDLSLVSFLALVGAGVITADVMRYAHAQSRILTAYVQAEDPADQIGDPDLGEMIAWFGISAKACADCWIYNTRPAGPVIGYIWDKETESRQPIRLLPIAEGAQPDMPAIAPAEGHATPAAEGDPWFCFLCGKPQTGDPQYRACVRGRICPTCADKVDAEPGPAPSPPNWPPYWPDHTREIADKDKHANLPPPGGII